MRESRSGGRSGADRWIVSYADLMTLLFAFFTTLYAASSVDSNKMTPVASSLQEAFAMVPGSGAPGASAVPAISPLPETRVEEDLEARLARELSDAIAANRLELTRDPRGLVVSLPDDATFAIGSAEVTPEARILIDRVGGVLRPAANGIRIEGHTDNVPIRTARYASNWELSTARASAVVAFLVNMVGIESGRLSAAGYGEFHPRGPNDTDAHRARNRRVDLVVLDTGDLRERQAQGASTGGEERDANP